MTMKIPYQDLRGSSIAAKEPYHIPGYAGHKPQYVFQCGETFGRTTHKLLTTMDSRCSSQSLLQPISIVRPSSAPGKLSSASSNFHNVSNLLETRNNGKLLDHKFKPQMRSGYMGHVPGVRFSLYHGKNYPNICDEALTVFSTNQQIYRKKLEETRKISRFHRPLVQQAKTVNGSSYRPPLRALDPQTSNRNYSSITENGHHQSPYFMKGNNSQKHFIPGYAGHVPFYKDHGGKSFKSVTNSALNVFTAQQERQRHINKRPLTPKSITELKSPLDVTVRGMAADKQRIYATGKGIIPNYSGFVPGEKYRHGQRFTVSTKSVQI